VVCVCNQQEAAWLRLFYFNLNNLKKSLHRIDLNFVFIDCRMQDYYGCCINVVADSLGNAGHDKQDGCHFKCLLSLDLLNSVLMCQLEL